MRLPGPLERDITARPPELTRSRWLHLGAVGVHVYTASGAALALLIVLAAVDGDAVRALAYASGMRTSLRLLAPADFEKAYALLYQAASHLDAAASRSSAENTPCAACRSASCPPRRSRYDEPAPHRPRKGLPNVPALFALRRQ